MTDLAELIARVEAATGPDIELSFAIVKAIGASNYEGSAICYYGFGEHPTSSVDCAIALVERVLGDVKVCITKYRKGGGRAEILADGTSHDVADEQGATPALAICLALLRALSTGGGDE